MLSPLQPQNQVRHGHRSNRDADQRYHAGLEVGRIGSGVEDERPPGVDDVVPHAVDDTVLEWCE